MGNHHSARRIILPSIMEKIDKEPGVMISQQQAERSQISELHSNSQEDIQINLPSNTTHSRSLSSL